MKNLEEQLSKIKFREIGVDERNILWQGIMVEKVKKEREKGPLVIANFNFTKMSIIASIVLVLVLGTGGMVVASDSSVPGDALFRMDLAAEKMRMSFAGEEKQSELRLKFAAEREKEMKEVSERRKETGSETSAQLSAKQSADLKVSVDNLELSIQEESDVETKAQLQTTLRGLKILLEGDSQSSTQGEVESNSGENKEEDKPVDDSEEEGEKENKDSGIEINLEGYTQ